MVACLVGVLLLAAPSRKLSRPAGFGLRVAYPIVAWLVLGR
jgi:hypothetical protein